MSRAFGWVSVTKPDGEKESLRYDIFVSLLFKALPLDMMKAHAAMLVAGEAGELVDAIKKEIIYNKPLDKENLIEELGDLRFGIQAVMNLYDISEAQILQANAEKLSKKYKGLAYSDQAAQERADKNGPTKDQT